MQHSDIPIALRTLIPIGRKGGSFSGTLTGGNGRPTRPDADVRVRRAAGRQQHESLVADGDHLYVLEGLLIDPNGMQLSVEPNFDANGNTDGEAAA